MNVIYFNEESRQLAKEKQISDKVNGVIEKVAITACTITSIFAIVIICCVLL